MAGWLCLYFSAVVVVARRRAGFFYFAHLYENVLKKIPAGRKLHDKAQDTAHYTLSGLEPPLGASAPHTALWRGLVTRA